MEEKFFDIPILHILEEYFSGHRDKMVAYLQRRGEEDALWRIKRYSKYDLELEVEKGTTFVRDRYYAQDELRMEGAWEDWAEPHALMVYLQKSNNWGEGDDVYKLYHDEEESTDTITRFTYRDKSWGVGDMDKLRQMAIESAKESLEYFNHDFLQHYIDGAQMASDWESGERDAIWDSPESYLDSDDRELSEEQEREISEKREQISALEEEQNNLDVDIPEEEQRYEEISDEIRELEDEIEEIEQNPDGDWDEDKLEAVLEERLDEIKSDPLEFLKGLGMDDYKYWKQYVDEDEAAEAGVDEDGIGHFINSYDHSCDETEYEGDDYGILLMDAD